MAVGDIWQVRFVSRFGDQLGMNIRHYRVATNTGGGSVAAENVSLAMHIAFESFYRALLSEHADYVGTAAQKIVPLPPGNEHVTITTPPSAGLVIGDGIPRQVAGLLSLRTDLAGRRFRGRMYIPFPSEDSNSPESLPTTPYLTALSLLAGEVIQIRSVITGSITETFAPVVFHRQTLTADHITSVIVRSAWATQRRRGSFGRANPVQEIGAVIS